ncbi:hypothetical protein BT63DRAFT_13 [Microthyrium microscopicum]|uniref:Uncharacterized protein n=1 Tax=Microthyrium microscopicum TaxID=703497 RepID=A0A6A6URG0_9PEZI|nr:hypothetical protein BT63DRAFT_13 [Microthyrium microscopicum]
MDQWTLESRRQVKLLMMPFKKVSGLAGLVQAKQYWEQCLEIEQSTIRWLRLQSRATQLFPDGEKDSTSDGQAVMCLKPDCEITPRSGIHFSTDDKFKFMLYLWKQCHDSETLPLNPIDRTTKPPQENDGDLLLTELAEEISAAMNERKSNFDAQIKAAFCAGDEIFTDSLEKFCNQVENDPFCQFAQIPPTSIPWLHWDMLKLIPKPPHPRRCPVLDDMHRFFLAAKAAKGNAPGTQL